MRILHLTLKKKWFDMIASGEKKEEYREIKPYWESRLYENQHSSILNDEPLFFIRYDAILFTNGYQKNAPSITIECKDISIGTAKPEWSDNWQGEVFVIKLGEIIK